MKFIPKLVSTIFSPIVTTRRQSLGHSERLSALTTLTSSLEYISQRRQLDKGGLNDWQVMRKDETALSPIVRKVLDLVSDPRVTVGLHCARVGVSAALLLPGESRWRGAGSLFLAGTTALLYPRHRYGTDGSDQVTLLVQSATGLARMSKNPETTDALLWYVALQANLSYLASGWVKLLGDKWRSGEALPGVLRTKTYGFEKGYQLARKYPRITTALQYSVLAMECLFPIVYLFDGRLVRVFISMAASFHLANGFVMGLGRFMTAFTSMHPMVAYTTTPRSNPAVADRDDRAVGTVAVVLAGAAAIAVVTAVQKRLRVLEGWPTTRVLTTRHGNELQYETGGASSGDAPVVIMVTGLASTSEHFAWITEKIIDETEYGVIAYARAGYAGSRRTSAKEYDLQESVDDLVDLVNSVSSGSNRPVVLLGHSIGGELVRRAVAELPDGVLGGAIYLDPSHPQELQRSSGQSLGAKNLGGSLLTAQWALRLGTGILMSRPTWLANLPQSYRGKIYAQYSDARLWEAAAREWKAVERDFRAYDREFDRFEIPGLVLAAQHTVDTDPEQMTMYEEFAATHRSTGDSSNLIVIEGADHDTLLTGSRTAHSVAQLVIDFIRDQATGAASSAPSPHDVQPVLNDSERVAT